MLIRPVWQHAFQVIHAAMNQQTVTDRNASGNFNFHKIQIQAGNFRKTESKEKGKKSLCAEPLQFEDEEAGHDDVTIIRTVTEKLPVVVLLPCCIYCSVLNMYT